MNPQERKQAAILSTAIVVVLIGGVFWVRSIMGGGPKAQPPASPVASTDPQVVSGGWSAYDSPQAAARHDSASSDPIEIKSAPPSGADPFRKVLSSDVASSNPTVTLDEARAKADENRRRQLAKVNPKDVYPPIEGQFPLPDAGTMKPLSPTAALNDSFKLEGIVANGAGSMAVVTYGGTTLYLKKGDVFGDGIRVKAIHRQYASFSHEDKVYRADIGGGLQG